MKIKIDNVFFEVECNQDEISTKIPIVFLHGFTGSIDDWKFLKSRIPDNFTPIFIDLLGHGKSSSPKDKKYYSPNCQTYFIKKIFDQINVDNLVLAGYSMGGRLSLNFAEKYPEKIIGLILESTSFGIKSENERAQRIINDEKLAEEIGQIEIDTFIDKWLSIPLFNSLQAIPIDKFKELRARKIRTNNHRGLRNSLLGFGAGKMNYFLPHLSKLYFKVLLIVGEHDQKYIEQSSIAQEQFPDCMLKIVEKTGHNIHFEKPEEFLKLINDFLKNIRDYE